MRIELYKDEKMVRHAFNPDKRRRHEIVKRWMAEIKPLLDYHNFYLEVKHYDSSKENTDKGKYPHY